AYRVGTFTLGAAAFTTPGEGALIPRPLRSRAALFTPSTLGPIPAARKARTQSCRTARTGHGLPPCRPHWLPVPVPAPSRSHRRYTTPSPWPPHFPDRAISPSPAPAGS